MKKNSEENNYYEILRLCDRFATAVGCVLMLGMCVYLSKVDLSEASNAKSKFDGKEVFGSNKQKLANPEIIFRDSTANIKNQKVR